MNHHDQSVQPLSHTLSVRLPQDDFAQLEQRARCESRTVSNLVRLLLDQSKSVQSASQPSQNRDTE